MDIFIKANTGVSVSWNCGASNSAVRFSDDRVKLRRHSRRKLKQELIAEMKALDLEVELDACTASTKTFDGAEPFSATTEVSLGPVEASSAA